MKLAVVGSINMDMTVTVDRLPLKGETLKGKDVKYVPGGKGANQAVAMAKLGAEVTLFSCVGNDDNGEKLLKNLDSIGVETKFIKKVNDVPTGIAMITVGEGDNTIVIVPGANNSVNKAYIDEMKTELRNYDMIILQHEIPLETVHYLVGWCSKQNIPVVLNPAPAADVPMEIIDKVTYLTPNEHETVLIFGEDKKTEEILKQYPEKLIITQGSRGVTTCLNSGEIYTVPGRKTTVVDTTGAGDTLNGAFAVRIAKGDDIKNALVYANTAASLSIEKYGAQGGMPIAEEVGKTLYKM